MYTRVLFKVRMSSCRVDPARLVVTQDNLNAVLAHWNAKENKMWQKNKLTHGQFDQMTKATLTRCILTYVAFTCFHIITIAYNYVLAFTYFHILTITWHIYVRIYTYSHSRTYT